MADGMTAAHPPASALAQLTLAQAVCTRLCHDLGGPAGALSGALEMLGDAGDDAAEVARDAARIIDRRLRFWRAALGGPAGDLDGAALAQLAEGLTLGRRATVDLTALAPAMLVEAVVAQPLLLAMLVGVEALPRGGALRVTGGVAGFALRPDGPGAAWPPGLAALLAGQAPVPVPRAVALPLLGATAAAARVRLDMAPAADGGAAALMLTPLP
jgi:histidine phosphotransferase ChpT